MKTLLSALVVLFTANVGDVCAKDFSKIGVYGFGGSSCGTWIEVRKDPTSMPALGYLAWVQGFLTAATTYSPADYNHTDMEGINAFMDKYCAANPLKQISMGALELVDQLQIRKGQ